jgi:hypothetical protein
MLPPLVRLPPRALLSMHALWRFITLPPVASLEEEIILGALVVVAENFVGLLDLLEAVSC